jgi:hypothetical protein
MARCVYSSSWSSFKISVFVTCQFNSMSAQKNECALHFVRRWESCNSNLPAQANSILSWVWVFEWFFHFKEGQMCVESDEHPGWYLTSTNDESLACVWFDVISQKTDYIWSGWRGRKFLWLMSGHLNWRFGSEVCLRQVCSKTADTGIER